MAAVQCENFVGNAWKKDLCLNCFKSKEEHVFRNGLSVPLVTRIPDAPKEGILKGNKSNSPPKGNKVNFLNNEYEVIGFGGDDVYSEDEDCPDVADGRNQQTEEEEEEEAESEEERAFHKLTKSNTDYNSVPENLREPKEGEVKKVVEPLKLGKQMFDDKGNKKTLLVSVTPFGDQTAVGKKNKLNLNGFRLNGVDAKTNGHQSDSESEPTKNKTKQTTEKTETVEKNGIAPKIIQEEEEEDPTKVAGDKSLKRSQPLDKNFKFKLSKTAETNGKEEMESKSDVVITSEKVSSLIEKAKKKVEPIITDNQSFKFRTKQESNKSVVLDIYKIRDREKAKTETNEEKIIKSVLLPEINNKFLSSANASTKDKSEKLSNGFASLEQKKAISPAIEMPKIPKSPTEIIENGINRSKLIANVSSLHRHHFQQTKKEEESGEREWVEGVANGFARTKENEENEENDSPAGKNVDGAAEEKQTDSESEEKFKKTPFESLENFERIIQGEEITLFSADKRSEGAKGAEERKMPEISRELAGEPDGRADSDEAPEPPALPSKPPPPLSESRTTFLQELAAGSDGLKMPDKPKVPVKPLIIHSKKINLQSPVHSLRAKSPSLEKFLDLTSLPVVKSHPPLQESLSSDSAKNQKRQAPQPPSPKEDVLDGYAAVLAETESDDSGGRRSESEEAAKRICRSTENLLELIAEQEQRGQIVAEGLEEISVPEPVPRRSLSLSQDSLVPGESADSQLKKKPSRGRFLLRKLLHLGKPKEPAKDSAATRHKTPLPPTPKPKIEIIHPSDLSGSRVEVVPPARTPKSRRTSSSASSSSGEQRESDVLSDSSTSHSMSSSGNESQTTTDGAKKPPPPPRANSLEAWTSKPARPPPPKTLDALRQNNASWNSSAQQRIDNHYVNLGEARSGLAPNKPMRTGSLREVNPDPCKRLTTITTTTTSVAVANTQPEDSDYESFIVAPGQHSTPLLQSEDNLYECVQMPVHRSSLPECDSTLTDSADSNHAKDKRPQGKRNAPHRRSEGNVDVASDYLKLKFIRSTSLPYCSSETESEIYSPYSFYGSEMGEEDFESSTSGQTLRMSRLKLKKGRSIVHKNLEDNYGAVVVANHEALAQVAEQMRQGPAPPPALRALSSALNLRWTDFALPAQVPGVLAERRVFYPALWGAHPVTLGLVPEQGLRPSFHAKGPFNLEPLAELNDLVPAGYLPMLNKEPSELVQASISVLPRLQIETVETYGRHMSAGALTEESKKEVNFVLLQIINAFKSLQAEGIEEAPENLTDLIVCREDRDPHPRVCITHSLERSPGPRESSLCRCLARALRDILPPTDLSPLVASVLLQEKAESLSRAKGVLEYSLWGPADIAFGRSDREREGALQRWLDLERATVLHGLVRTRAELTVLEEWQLLFLVKTNAKMMAEASLLLESGCKEEASTA